MQTNIRNTNSIKKNCQHCQFFISYVETYDDPLEPDEMGVCTHPENSEQDEFFGDDMVCDLFIKKF